MGPATGSTVNFDNASGQNRPLDGQYPSSVVDWGSGKWYLAAPWGKFNTKSVSFNGGGMTSASFKFVTPRRLVSIDPGTLLGLRGHVFVARASVAVRGVVAHAVQPRELLDARRSLTPHRLVHLQRARRRGLVGLTEHGRQR